MDASWPSWEQWLESLNPADRAAALTLRARFDALGAQDPEGWARSEVGEHIAQLPRYLVLRHLWREDIDAWNEAVVSLPAGSRLLAAGANRDDLVQVARAAAYEAVFAVLNRIDEGSDPEAPQDCPGWRLMEVGPDGRLTGRDVGGLHEDLQSLDPSGRDGRDLWE